MIDSVTLSQQIELNEEELRYEYGWNKSKNSKPYPYYWVFSRRLDRLGLYLRFYPKAYDGKYFFPSRLQVEFDTLPKFMFGSNVYYLSEKDLSDFDIKFRKALITAGIYEDVNIETLEVKKMDLSFNILFESEKIVRKIINAFKESPCWNESYPIQVEDDGIYFRHKSKVIRKVDTNTGNTGIGYYNKIDESLYDPSLMDKGILRLEIRLSSRDIVKRIFGRTPTIPAIYKRRVVAKKLFERNIKISGVYPNCRMVSIKKAQKMICKHIPKSRRRIKWLLRLYLVRAISSRDNNIGKQLKSKSIVNSLRGYFLRKKLGILIMFFRDDDPLEIPLYQLAMNEIEETFRDNSPFQKTSTTTVAGGKKDSMSVAGFCNSVAIRWKLICQLVIDYILYKTPPFIGFINKMMQGDMT